MRACHRRSTSLASALSQRSRRHRPRKCSRFSSQEVDKFSALSSTWWDPSANPLLGMNAVRVPYILSQSQLQQPHSFLDVGCGGGILSEALVRRTASASVVGLDLSGPQIAAAQAHAQQTLHPTQLDRLEYRQENVEDMENDLLFDVVCCLEVLEHIPEASRSHFLPAVCERVRPGGHLFISTLNKTPKSFAAGIVGAEYVLRLLPVGTHTWEWFLSPEDVERHLRPLGLQCVDVSGMVVQPTFSMLCGEFEWKLDPNDTDVNWIGCYKKEGGANNEP